MLELSNEAMTTYWAAVSPAAPGIIAAMELTEDWLPEQDESELAQLSKWFATLPERFRQLESGAQQSAFVNDLLVILAYLPASRSLYLTHWLDRELSPLGCDFLRTLNSLYEVADPAQVDRVGLGLLRARLRFMRKTVVFQAVFAPERLLILNTALAGEAK